MAQVTRGDARRQRLQMHRRLRQRGLAEVRPQRLGARCVLLAEALELRQCRGLRDTGKSGESSAQLVLLLAVGGRQALVGGIEQVLRLGQVQCLAYAGECLVGLAVALPHLVPDPSAGHQLLDGGDDAVLVRVEAELWLAQCLEAGPALGRPVVVLAIFGGHPLQQQADRIAGRQPVEVRRLQASPRKAPGACAQHLGELRAHRLQGRVIPRQIKAEAAFRGRQEGRRRPVLAVHLTPELALELEREQVPRGLGEPGRSAKGVAGDARQVDDRCLLPVATGQLVTQPGGRPGARVADLRGQQQ